MVMVLLLTACGKENSSFTPGKPSAEKRSLEDILEDINNDFDAVIAELKDELDDVFTKVGDSYSSYLSSKDAITQWYELSHSKANKLFERTSENAVEYYKTLVATIDHDDSAAIDDAMEEYYDTVYNDTFEGFYDAIYDGAFENIYDKYYNGVIDAARDAVNYSEWLDVKMDCYSEWLDAKMEIYSTWLDAKMDIYGTWLDVKLGFWMGDFDIDSILAENKEKEAPTATPTATPTPEETPTSTPTTSSPNWRQFLKDYEAFIDSYIAVLKKYSADPTDFSILGDYMNMMTELSEWDDKYDDMSDGLDDPTELAEFIQEWTRIYTKMITALADI